MTEQSAAPRDVPADKTGPDLDIQVRTAKAFPRDIETVCVQMEKMATLSVAAAEACFYALPRSGTIIRGPSVRLAEMMAGMWGNLHVGARIADTDGYTVTAEAFCWDLERNVKIVQSVKRGIRDKAGRPYSLDMRTNTENAACSLALRNAIFKIIPRQIVDHIMEACMKAATQGGASGVDLEKKAQEILKRLDGLGVPASSVLDFFEVQSVSGLTEDHVRTMIGVGTAIKDGRLSVGEAFVKAPQVVMAGYGKDEI